MTIKSMYTQQDAPKIYNSENVFVELPFSHLRLSWVNGVATADKSGGAKHFGGWQIGSDRAADDVKAMELETLPFNFTEAEWISRDEKSYSAWSARMIYAAPILARDDWWEEFDPSKGKSVKRHRLDFLVYLGTLVDKKIVAYGPATLSSTGFAASAIMKAFKAFEKDTSEARNEFAPGVPSAFFYVPVGTFGDDRKSEKAGQSSYVPCQYQKPKSGSWGEEALKYLYVGDEIVGTSMISFAGEAADWLADTRSNRTAEFSETPVKSVDDVNQAFASTDQAEF